MMIVDSRRIVEEGYDLLDHTYRDWVDRAEGGYRSSFLTEILRRVPPGTDVLEIGCGPGTDAPALSAGRRYMGIDLSSVQLDHAKRAAPAGTFLHADALEIAFPPSSFDAVVGFYVFNHVPQEHMEPLFRRILGWLRPAGRLCASFGTSDNQGAVEPMWLGRADMYFASLPVDENDALLEKIGFAIEFADTVTEDEEGVGPATFNWVIGRKSAREGTSPS
jgi:SAM-dependent methyltransferase